ncbi:MAG: signal peptidase II [Lachnospiraceae bacterium]|nr:signal peptidase II [Lachnospiraceae bacterium]
MNRKVFITNIVYSALFIVLVAADRITKKLATIHLIKGDIELIPDVLSLHYLENRGAAWGLFQNAFWLFFIITLIVIFVMVIFYARIPFERKYLLLRFSLIVLSAGAVGNFIDRAVWHYVVDFIYFKWINFPVFNVADCFVCIAAFLLLYCLLFRYKDEDFLWKKKS